jgi:hypothetical protein
VEAGDKQRYKILFDFQGAIRRYIPENRTLHKFLGFEVLTPVVINGPIFWDTTPWSPLKVNRRFGGTHCRVFSALLVHMDPVLVRMFAVTGTLPPPHFNTQGIFVSVYWRKPSRDTSVGRPTWLRVGRPRNSGSISSRDKKLSPPQRPERLWGPPSILSNEYRCALSRG